MGIKPSLAYASLRLSIGRYTSSKDIDQAIEIITNEVTTQREQNILWERRA
jgi:cysteine desulfurase